jgi:alpha-tubulin suppressor-like RCC1 family protein
LEDALYCIELNPSWPKGYYRAAKSSFSLCNYIEANKYIDKAIALSSNDKMCIELKNKINLNNNNNNNNNNKERNINTNNNSKELGCIYSWGINIDGQLGLGTPLVDKSYPTIINDLRGKYITDISCGTSHSIAITAAGEVYSYGSNKYSQLGLGNAYIEEYYPVPRLIPSLVGVVIAAVSVGAAHTVAISSDSRVFSWGVGMQGQLGLGTT